MKQAIDLALKAQYQTDPNPVVGAVLVDRKGSILSVGFHRKAGAPHAEVEALGHYHNVPDGSILFVTLEPCNFFGRTPPCTELILKKQVKQVVIGCRDPNPKVSGNGIERLKSAGVKIVEGVLETECRNLNRVFNKHITSLMPFVTVKAAISIDGKTAMASGESQWITGEEARKAGHRLRSSHQAIAVGSKTLIRDNPELTDRVSETPRQPQRVVFSSSGDFPMDSHFVNQVSTQRFLITGNSINPHIARTLEQKGILILVGTGVRPEIQWAMKTLYREGICSLLVEGGAELTASFIKEKMVDQFYLFVAGKIIGSSKAPSWSGETGISKLKEVPRLNFDRLEKLGEDLLIVAYPKH
jgi:diaminohydroxyphosphoribosylaminopyrimidine deaminase/5-amino-6-(5-phosphoribosylamino)uracil reductase